MHERLKCLNISSDSSDYELGTTRSRSDEGKRRAHEEKIERQLNTRRLEDAIVKRS